MKKILLTIDGSNASLDAARFLVRLGFRQTVEIDVVTVIFEPPSQKGFLVDGWSKGWLKRKHDQATRTFEEVRAIFRDSDAELCHLIRNGHPGETIVKLANELQPDLVVVGAKGHSAVARILLGSTSDYVATHVLGSVLVVRPNEGSGHRRHLRVAIGCEPSPPAEMAFEEFTHLGWSIDNDVQVVSVTDRSSVDESSVDEAAKEYLERIKDRLVEDSRSARARVIHSDHIGDGLVDYIESNQVDLIVVGETSRGGFERLLLGSTTRFVLRHAPSSVLIARGQSMDDVQTEQMVHQAAST